MLLDNQPTMIDIIGYGLMSEILYLTNISAHLESNKNRAVKALTKNDLIYWSRMDKREWIKVNEIYYGQVKVKSHRSHDLFTLNFLRFLG